MPSMNSLEPHHSNSVQMTNGQAPVLSVGPTSTNQPSNNMEKKKRIQDTLHVSTPADKSVDRGDLCDLFFARPGLKKLSFHEGYAFAFFETPQSAAQTLHALVTGEAGPKGVKLNVEYARVSYRPNYYHPDTTHPPNRRLHVTHFPRNTTVLELRRMFSRYPGFEAVEYHIKYAYVLFKSEAFASFALMDLNTRTNLIVSFAKAENKDNLTTMFEGLSMEPGQAYNLHQPSAAYPAPHQILAQAALRNGRIRTGSPNIDEYFMEQVPRPRSWVPQGGEHSFADVRSASAGPLFEMDPQLAALQALRHLAATREEVHYDDRISDASTATYFNPPSPGLDYLNQRRPSPPLSQLLAHRRPSPMYDYLQPTSHPGSNPISPNLVPTAANGDVGHLYIPHDSSRPPSRPGLDELISNLDWGIETKRGGWNPWNPTLFEEADGTKTPSSVKTPSAEPTP